jgi:MFS family permease
MHIERNAAPDASVVRLDNMRLLRHQLPATKPISRPKSLFALHDAKPNRARNVVALTIVAVALAAMFVGAIMPTPLYPLYQRAFGFSGITLTLIYAVYVLGNLVSLLFFGRLADQVGRRSAILPAIGFGIASAVVFAAASGTAWLFAARALSGFSTGLGAGAATAWIAEL